MVRMVLIAAMQQVRIEEQRVAVVPGTAFGACGEGFVRCAYATRMADIEVALAWKPPKGLLAAVRRLVP